MRAIIVVAILACLVAVAQARWKPEYGKADPAIQEWFAKQHNQKGEWCCDNSDGHPYYGGVKYLPDGRIALDGGYILPAYMVIKGKNPTGHAIWWYVDQGNGTRTSYCFAHGPLI